MLSAQVRVILNPRRKKNGQVGKKEVLEAKEAKDGKHPPVHLPNPNGPSREGGPDEVDKERHPRRGEGGEGIPASEGNRDHADVAAVIDSDVVLTVLIADTTDDPIDDREVGGAKAEADGAVRTSERGLLKQNLAQLHRNKTMFKENQAWLRSDEAALSDLHGWCLEGAS